MSKKNSPVPAIVGCLLVQLCVGILYLWSVFRTPIVLAFDWSDNAAKMVSSYMLFAFVFGNLIGGFINDKKGPRFTSFLGVILFSLGIGLTGLLTPDSIALINVTYSLLAGLGSGIAYGACISCVQKWMPHRRGLASGLAVSAFGLSTVIFTPVSRWLMDAFTSAETGIVDFQAVFFILAAVFFVIGILACFLISLPSQSYLSGLPMPAGRNTASVAVRTIRCHRQSVPSRSGAFSLRSFLSTAPGTSPSR